MYDFQAMPTPHGAGMHNKPLIRPYLGLIEAPSPPLPPPQPPVGGRALVRLTDLPEGKFESLRAQPE